MPRSLVQLDNWHYSNIVILPNCTGLQLYSFVQKCRIKISAIPCPVPAVSAEREPPYTDSVQEGRRLRLCHVCAGLYGGMSGRPAQGSVGLWSVTHILVNIYKIVLKNNMKENTKITRPHECTNVQCWI